MISVIIPVYNKEKFVSQTIESVLIQSYKHFELIIVNDGSTDSSLQAIRVFNDARIKILDQNNSGVSVARNTGVKQARYDWIAFLDADDWWDKDFLSEVSQAIKENQTDRVFATGRTHVFSDHKVRYSNALLPKDGEADRVNYFQVASNYLPVVNSSNCVISKGLLIEQGLFKEGQKNHEDHDLWFRVAAVHNEVFFINKPLSFYRKDMEDSGSNVFYHASDFLRYLSTLAKVKKKIFDTDRQYLQQYLNKFILLTYIKYYSKYSLTEKREIQKAARPLLNNYRFTIIKMLNLLPFDLYWVLKKFR